MTNIRPVDQEELRKLVWSHAGTDRSLEWVLERKDQFTVGELGRDEQGYYLPVSDVYLDKNQRVYLIETELRERDFTEAMRRANTDYIRAQKAAESSRRSRISRIRRKVVGTLATVVAISVGIGLGRIAYTEYNRPERVVAREIERQERKRLIQEEKAEAERKKLEEKRKNEAIAVEKKRVAQFKKDALEIIPSDGLRIPMYTFEDGSFVILYEGAPNVGRSETTRLCINYNNSERFISGDWDIWPEEDADRLAIYESWNGKEWIRNEGNGISGEKIRLYENLVSKIARVQRGEEKTKQHDPEHSAMEQLKFYVGDYNRF